MKLVILMCVVLGLVTVPAAANKDSRLIKALAQLLKDKGASQEEPVVEKDTRTIYMAKVTTEGLISIRPQVYSNVDDCATDNEYSDCWFRVEAYKFQQHSTSPVDLKWTVKGEPAVFDLEDGWYEMQCCRVTDDQSHYIVDLHPYEPCKVRFCHVQGNEASTCQRTEPDLDTNNGTIQSLQGILGILGLGP